MSSDQCHVYLILLLIVFCRSSCSVTINLSGPTLCVLSFNVSWLKNSLSFSFVLLVTCQPSVSVILKKVILPVLLESESFSRLFQITQHHGIVHKMSSNSGQWPHCNLIDMVRSVLKDLTQMTLVATQWPIYVHMSVLQEVNQCSDTSVVKFQTIRLYERGSNNNGSTGPLKSKSYQKYVQLFLLTTFNHLTNGVSMYVHLVIILNIFCYPMNFFTISSS